MEAFKDFHGANVRLAFNRGSFSQEPKHVLVICRYDEHWLLTKHPKRGLEFPGGKVEPGESIEEAAKREVFEETGARLNSLQFIGEYEVEDGGEAFVKAIFYGQVRTLEEMSHFHETEGPALIQENLLEERFSDVYSFIMKDFVIEKSLRYIEQLKSGQS
ncbi:RNA deprotection pyrophosphohydrolase [Robertmurraya massiliosenegalensis]|uniref:RNA deprotection pyrophosphohydrolase n=1 Tax=Robertmurraya TaxID=2837507 RepID=UPI0039A6CFD2